MNWKHSERTRFKVEIGGEYAGWCDGTGCLHLRPEFDNEEHAEALKALGFECEGEQDAGEDQAATV